MKPHLRRILLVIVGLILVGQFFGPDLTNPASDPSDSIKSDTTIPPSIVAMLDRACFDCHSNESRWPWYSRVTPANYLIAMDVNDGRKQMNFSEWATWTTGRKYSRLEQLYDQVSYKEMPLPRYLLLHPEARLTDDDRKTLTDWAAETQDGLMGD